MSEKYDSTDDTLKHIRCVEELGTTVIAALRLRLRHHDESKLSDEEKPVFDRVTPQLRELKYGSPEYAYALKWMGPALEHHYQHNRHHPEHFQNGILEMDLLDLLEMLIDWYAASKRHPSADFNKSFDINMVRFAESGPHNVEARRHLIHMLQRTAQHFGWCAGRKEEEE